MRPSQLTAIQQTTAVKGHPFDAIDLTCGIITAITGSPIAFLFSAAQYFARRSPRVTQALMVAMNVPDSIAETNVMRGILPGVNALLPAIGDEPEVESMAVDEADPFGDTPPPAQTTKPIGADLKRLPRRVTVAEMKPYPKSSTSLPLGIDTSSEPRWIDLQYNTLHVGLYGQSGCGKDSLLRVWFLYLCKTNAPAELQFAFLDGKGDWLTAPLAALDHMFIPPAGGYGKTGDAAILRAIEAIDQEAQRRQRLITAAGCRTREQYVAKTGQPMPLLIVVATDVMTSIAAQVEELLIALVSKARSLGLRVVVSMQTPTGKATQWRSNLSTVIAGNLQAGSQDEPALGISVKDMRYRPSQLPSPQERPGVFVVRQGAEQHLVQAPYLDEERFDALCAALPATTATATPNDELLSQLINSVPVQSAKNAAFSGVDTSTVRYGTSGTDGNTTPNTTSTVLPDDDEAKMIRNLLHQFSKNKVAELLGGSKTTAYRRIDRALGVE